MKTKKVEKMRLYEIVIAVCMAGVFILLKLLEPYYRGGEAFDTVGVRLYLGMIVFFIIGGIAFAKEFKELCPGNTEDDWEDETVRKNSGNRHRHDRCA